MCPAGEPAAQCLRHGFMLHTKYQVVYPFPTFQPAFQLKKDQVVLLNTSYSLVACAVSVHSAGGPRIWDTRVTGCLWPPHPGVLVRGAVRMLRTSWWVSAGPVPQGLWVQMGAPPLILPVPEQSWAG